MQIVTINWQQALPIRHQVLWPDKDEEFCRVSGDDSARHFGVFIDKILVCVASIYADGNSVRLRKFATLAAYQGQGIGSAMLQHILAQLRSGEFKVFYCDAREAATAIYEKIGMQRQGQRFYKERVAFYKMSMAIN
ncbi:MAG: hypothetical protein OFPI_45010 [Osedax symbiont Rs2]|nr:MAG: hypothetical protein OFPI_45010 [Osedax symbiont Rs2]